MMLVMMLTMSGRRRRLFIIYYTCHCTGADRGDLVDCRQFIYSMIGINNQDHLQLVIH